MSTIFFKDDKKNIISSIHQTLKNSLLITFFFMYTLYIGTLSGSCFLETELPPWTDASFLSLSALRDLSSDEEFHSKVFFSCNIALCLCSLVWFVIFVFKREWLFLSLVLLTFFFGLSMFYLSGLNKKASSSSSSLENEAVSTKFALTLWGVFITFVYFIPLSTTIFYQLFMDPSLFFNTLDRKWPTCFQKSNMFIPNDALSVRIGDTTIDLSSSTSSPFIKKNIPMSIQFYSTQTPYSNRETGPKKTLTNCVVTMDKKNKTFSYFFTSPDKTIIS